MVLSQSPIDLNFSIGFFARWTQGMDNEIQASPYICSTCRQYWEMHGICVMWHDTNCTISIRMVKNTPHFIYLLTIHGGDILQQQVFFIGLLGHYFLCGKKR